MTLDVLVETILLFSNRIVFIGHFDSMAWLHRRVIVQILPQILLRVDRWTEPCSAYNPRAASIHRQGPWSSIILDLSSHICSSGSLVDDQSVGHCIRCSTTRNDLKSSIQFAVHRANHRISHQSLFVVCFWRCLCITSRTQAFAAFVVNLLEQE